MENIVASILYHKNSLNLQIANTTNVCVHVHIYTYIYKLIKLNLLCRQTIIPTEMLTLILDSLLWTLMRCCCKSAFTFCVCITQYKSRISTHIYTQINTNIHLNCGCLIGCECVWAQKCMLTTPYNWLV